MKKIYVLILAVFVGISILYSLNTSNSFRIILQLIGTFIIANEYYKVIRHKEDIECKSWSVFIMILIILQGLFLNA